MMSHNASPGGDPSKVETDLQERVVRARERYERAIAETQKLAVESPDGSQDSYGSHSIARALRLQHSATRRYSEALRALSEFVLDCKSRNCA